MHRETAKGASMNKHELSFLPSLGVSRTLTCPPWCGAADPERCSLVWLRPFHVFPRAELETDVQSFARKRGNSCLSLAVH